MNSTYVRPTCYLDEVRQRLQDPRLLTWLILAGSHLTVMGMSFVATIVMTHFITQFEYGSIALGMSIATVVGLATRFAADRLLVRDIVLHPEQANDYATASYCLRVVIALLSLIGVALIAGVRLTSVKWPIDVVLVYALFGCFEGLTPKEIFDSHSKMRQHASVYFFSNTLYALGVFVLLFALPLSWHRALAIGLIRLGTIILSFGAQFVLIRNLVKVSPWPQVRRVLGPVAATYSATLLPNVCSTVMCQYPGIHLGSVSGMAAVAPYGIAVVLASPLSLVLLQLGRVLNPDLVRVVKLAADRRPVVRFLSRYLTTMLGASGVLCGVAFFLAPVPFQVLFPDAYRAGIEAFRLLLIWVMIGTAFSYPVIQVLLALGKHSVFALGAAVGAGSSVLLSGLLCSHYGPSGAAMALVLSNSLLVAVTASGLFFILVGKRGAAEAAMGESSQVALSDT